MASCSHIELNYIRIHWHVENFLFCWHKTGERLDSPLFKINLPHETFWRLQLYPRGEDNGEFLSCYIFREEGGPEVVDVSTDFYVHFGSLTIPWYSEKIQSFKVHQREGLKCYVSRREILALNAAQMGAYILRFCCKIRGPEVKVSGNFIQLLRTRILVERIIGTDMFETARDFGGIPIKSIGIKSMLEDKKLININLSLDEDSLVIKINPVRCKEIKYAICKIILFKIGEKGSHIEHVRFWIGSIKKDIWRYQINRLEGTSTKPSLQSFSHESFIFRYDFVFSTGIVEEKCVIKEFVSYFIKYDLVVKIKDISLQQFWNANLKTTNSATTALDALELIHTTGEFDNIDFDLEKEKNFKVNKSILWTRCINLRYLTNNRALTLKQTKLANYYENFFRYLYTDYVKITSTNGALRFYEIAYNFNVELLKTKCRNFLIDTLDYRNAYGILISTHSAKDLTLKSAVQNFIVLHYDLVFYTMNWKNVNDTPELRRETLFLKYKK